MYYSRNDDCKCVISPSCSLSSMFAHLSGISETTLGSVTSSLSLLLLLPHPPSQPLLHLCLSAMFCYPLGLLPCVSSLPSFQLRCVISHQKGNTFCGVSGVNTPVSLLIGRWTWTLSGNTNVRAQRPFMGTHTYTHTQTHANIHTQTIYVLFTLHTQTHTYVLTHLNYSYHIDYLYNLSR